MFERFADDAREVVVAEQADARDLRHAYIGTEHLLLGLSRGRDTGGWKALARFGLGSDEVRAAIVRIVGEGAPGTLGDPDADALRSIGIDLDEVRRRVEEAFGPGALERPIRSRRGRTRGGKGCLDPAPGKRRALPFCPRAKKSLELALREAVALRDRHISTEHLLLGLSREGNGLAATILRANGADPQRLRKAVLEERSRGMGAGGDPAGTPAA